MFFSYKHNNQQRKGSNKTKEEKGNRERRTCIMNM